MRLFLLTLLLLLFCLPVSSIASNTVFTEKTDAELSVFLDDLGKQVSDFKTLATDFVQTKEMALFKDQLVLKGRIYLKNPSQLAWHVDNPLRYSVLITDKLIRQWDEETDDVQEVSLEKNPIFRNVLSQLTVWFSGDYGELLNSNTVRILGESPLTLEFIPKENNPGKNIIDHVSITFRDDRKYLEQIRIQEKGGDITTILFSDTRLNTSLDRSHFEVN